MDFENLTKEDNEELRKALTYAKSHLNLLCSEHQLVVSACESFMMQLNLIEVIKVGTSEPEIDVPDYFKKITDIDQYANPVLKREFFFKHDILTIVRRRHFRFEMVHYDASIVGRRMDFSDCFVSPLMEVPTLGKIWR